jgi:hypothetical protein
MMPASYGSRCRKDPQKGRRITSMNLQICNGGLTRRWLIAAAAALPTASASGGRAQSGGSAFVGNWVGTVEGVGGARLIITGVRPDGQVEGRMEFDLQSFVSPFGDAFDAGPNKTNHGVILDGGLRIESALGGTYDLTLQGDSLAGTYVRGTTFRGKASFRRS